MHPSDAHTDGIGRANKARRSEPYLPSRSPVYKT
jgi:hypothetical protein